MSNRLGRTVVNLYYSGLGERIAEVIKTRLPSTIPVIRSGLDYLVQHVKWIYKKVGKRLDKGKMKSTKKTLEALLISAGVGLFSGDCKKSETTPQPEPVSKVEYQPNAKEK